MKRLFAMLICLALVFSVMPQSLAANAHAQTEEEILAQRRDKVYNTMMDMATFMWRATEDMTYYFATSEVTIKAGRLYRGMPYTHARGTLASFMEYAGEANEKGEHDMVGITSEMFDGGSQHARLGNDCSGAVSVAYATVSSTTKNVGASTVTVNKGYIPVGIYTPDPASNSNGVQICIDNGEQVMYQSYAMAQRADIVSCSSHSMMVQAVDVVYAEDGTIDGELSTVTVVHQTPDLIRDNRYYTEGPYSEAEYGERVYRTFRIDEPKTFKGLFDSGYMPYTCKELIDASAVPEVQITDTETQHSFETIVSGTIKANRLIDCVTMTITDEAGNVVQQGTARGYRANAVGTNWDMNYDLSMLRYESPMKMSGHLNLNQLGAGNYHCQLDVRVMSGETMEKVRDFDFTVTEEDLKEGWVDNSDLEFTVVDGKNMAVCPVCGGDPVEWKVLPVISGATSLAAGHYYLDADRTQKGRYGIAGSATTCVHLNGHNIKSTSSQVFRMGSANGVLNVMGNGNVVGSHTTEAGATVHISSATAKAYLYGGNWGHALSTTRPTLGMEASTPKIVIYSGATLCRMEDAQGANVEIRGGSVELRGGRILDGTNTTGYGGNIRVYSSANFTGAASTFTMYDGIIAGGRAKYGGNVGIFRESSHGSKNRTFTMEGGLLYFGFAGYAANSEGQGGNIWASGTIAKVNINGGTVTYGKSYSSGGNIYAKSGAQLNIAGTVENGNGDYGSKGASGNNIYLIGAESTITKLTLTGTVQKPMVTVGYGGNIFCSYSDIIVDGGTISGGKASSRGGNIYMTNVAANLTVKNGGQIVGGSAPDGGNVDTNIAGAVINVESGAITGGTASNNGGDIRLHAAATVNISDGTVEDFYGNNGKITLSGKSNIGKLDMSSATLKIDSSWTGTADVNWGGSYVTDGVLTKVTCTDIAGKLIYNGETPVLSKDSKAYLAGAGVVKTDGESLFLSADEALAAADERSTVKLYTDESITLEKDAYVDINGHNVAVSGSGKLYGIDSSNDDYQGCGTAAVSGDVAEITTDPVTGNRYVALVENGVATFHRIALEPTHVSLRTKDAGIYYKARFNCDEALAQLVDKYGVVLSVDNMPGVDFLEETEDINRATSISTGFQPGVVATSGAVFNIMKASKSNSVNVRNGEMKIYANAYILLENGTVIMADETAGDTVADPDFDGAAYSLYDVLNAIDGNWADYEESHAAILDFYNTWAQHGMDNWQFENIQ